MAADPSKPFFPVESGHHPKPPSRKPQTLTAESKFWRSFKNSELASGLILPVTSIEFSPIPPHDLAFASSAAVHLFDGATLSPKPFSPLSSFSDVAYSPSFRCDGALLAAGGESGNVQIFRLDRSGHALRRFGSHARPVRLVRYPHVADKLHLFSGGDDALLSYWDVPSETQVLSFPGAHRDYIRAGSPSPVSSEVIATGSYDHTVKVWDVRVSSTVNPVLGFNHGAPVESVLFLPSGGLLATAGGNYVKIWDIIGGGRLVHTVEGHNKTVTSMCLGRIGNKESSGLGGGESRLMSVSIDGYLKIFDFAAFKITHSMRYPAQLLSVGFSPSGLARVVGTSNGTIYTGKKKKKEDDISGAKVVSEFDTFAPEPEKHVMRPNFRYFRRGQSEKPQETDYMVKRAARVKLAEYDRLLKEFKHKDALVAVLNLKNPNSIVAVMEELVARKKLLKTVVNLDTNELRLLLRFLHKYATLPRYARFLMGLTKRVLELHAENIRSNDELRGYVRHLKRVIAEEIKIQHSLQEIQGMISPLLVIAGR